MRKIWFIKHTNTIPNVQHALEVSPHPQLLHPEALDSREGAGGVKVVAPVAIDAGYQLPHVSREVVLAGHLGDAVYSCGTAEEEPVTK